MNTINEWSDFFKKANSSKLSPNEQKGLIGELSLLNYFIDKTGINSALGSWRGPISSSKDFIFDSTAFEVKCCEPSLASSDIKISSLDQLLIKPYKNLYLVIYEIAPSSAQSKNSFTLYSLVQQIYDKIGSNNYQSKSTFNQLLSDYGCSSLEEYSDIQWLMLNQSPKNLCRR